MNILTTEQLRMLQAGTDDTLTSLVDALNERADMQNALQMMMTPDDMLETFAELAVKGPDLMRVTLMTSMAAMANLQSPRAVRAALARRAAGD